mgnify:CR=1 FL=1
MEIRHPIVAGTFYPDNPDILKKQIKGFLDNATVEKHQLPVKALIVPHAGYIYSGPVAAYAFKLIENCSYKKIFLLGPSHNFSFDNLVSCAKGYWQTPLGEVKQLSKSDFPKLKQRKEIIESSEIHKPEHSLEVQLPFLQTVLGDFQIFPLLTGNIIDYKKIGDILLSIYDEKTLFLISSDLSHYLSYNQAKMVDKVTIDAILSNDIQRFNKYGDACGKTPIEILLNIANKKKWQPQLLCAMNSGETSGDIHLRQSFDGQESQVVGYASIAYYE